MLLLFQAIVVVVVTAAISSSVTSSSTRKKRKAFLPSSVLPWYDDDGDNDDNDDDTSIIVMSDHFPPFENTNSLLLEEDQRTTPGNKATNTSSRSSRSTSFGKRSGSTSSNGKNINSSIDDSNDKSTTTNAVDDIDNTAASMTSDSHNGTSYDTPTSTTNTILANTNVDASIDDTTASVAASVDSSTKTSAPASTSTTATAAESEIKTTTNRNANNTNTNNNEIEDILGFVSGEYPCAYGNVRGTLYAGSNGLHFVGSYFFFEKKVTIPWDDVRKVEKMIGDDDDGDDSGTTTGANNQYGIEVVMKDSNDNNNSNPETTHRFTNLHNPDRVWVLLVSLHNDSLMGHPRRRQSTSMSFRGLGKRRNSDPLLASQLHTFDDSAIIEEEDVDGGASGDFYSITNDVVTTTKKKNEEDANNNHCKAKDVATTSSTTTSTILSSATNSIGRSATDTFIMSTAGLDMHSVEHLAGKVLLQPIPCTCEDIKGKLFAGKGAVYFYGKKFWIWDKPQEILLKWSAIKQIQIIDPARKGGSESSSNIVSDRVSVGIRVVVTQPQHKGGGGEKEYRFLGMDNADRVWGSLVQLHNESFTQAGRSKARRHSGIRRMNSDPNLAALEIDLSQSESIDDVKITVSSSTVSASGRSPFKELAVSGRGGGGGEDQNEGDDVTDWEKLTQEGPTYTNVVVQEYELNCTLDRFFELFVQDGAEFSTSKFLESRGDYNLRTEPWERDGGEGGAQNDYRRVVHYTHPVNAPLAPPKADARKEQRYRRYGNHGLCFWSKTIVDGVPMADCFYVADRVRVIPRNDGQSVVVYLEFEITFVKSTMFKGIISKTTSSEFKVLFEALALYMSKAIGDAAHVEVEETSKPNQAAQVADTPKITGPLPIFLSKLQSNASLSLLASIIAMQMWILFEIRSMKQDIREMHQHITGVGVVNTASVISSGTCDAFQSNMIYGSDD